MSNKPDKFYSIVTDYYDKDVELGFEARAEANPLLDKIRNDFRDITVKYPFQSVLEIGCGPGFDIAWFASGYAGAEVTGIDISGKMVQLASDRISKLNLKNADALKADERQLFDHFKPGQFDMVYVYFGALNTTADLDFAAGQIDKLLKPDGHAVLTFVNKWYLREMLVQSLKLQFKTAFSRLKKEWGGYSPSRYLPSRCYSPKEIIKAFKDFKLLEKKGYSIFYPAWYNYQKIANKPKKAVRLWAIDQKVQNTFFWSKGEYTLFVFRKNGGDN